VPLARAYGLLGPVRLTPHVAQPVLLLLWALREFPAGHLLPRSGARPLQRHVRRTLERELTGAIVRGELPDGSQVAAAADRLRAPLARRRYPPQSRARFVEPPLGAAPARSSGRPGRRKSLGEVSRECASCS